MNPNNLSKVFGLSLFHDLSPNTANSIVEFWLLNFDAIFKPAGNFIWVVNKTKNEKWKTKNKKQKTESQLKIWQCCSFKKFFFFFLFFSFFSFHFLFSNYCGCVLFVSLKTACSFKLFIGKGDHRTFKKWERQEKIDLMVARPVSSCQISWRKNSSCLFLSFPNSPSSSWIFCFACSSRFLSSSSSCSFFSLFFLSSSSSCSFFYSFSSFFLLSFLSSSSSCLRRAISWLDEVSEEETLAGKKGEEEEDPCATEGMVDVNSWIWSPRVVWNWINAVNDDIFLDRYIKE